jgi:hypothetical protein
MPVKEKDFSAIEEKKIESIVSKTKAEILAERQGDEDIKKWYAENGEKRFECKITSTRKGEKTFELMVERPENPNKPKKIVGKTGVWLKGKYGLPMYVLQRLMSAYDLTAEGKEDSEMGADAGEIFRTMKMPRYNVQIGSEIK